MDADEVAISIMEILEQSKERWIEEVHEYGGERRTEFVAKFTISDAQNEFHIVTVEKVP